MVLVSALFGVKSLSFWVVIVFGRFSVGYLFLILISCLA
jgi:hypothetical protein